jgi:lipoate-protein ligase A
MDWRLISEEMLEGSIAMALDEVAAETVAAGGPATVRVYRWFPSTVSLGYGNDADVVDWAFCEKHNVGVTRRPTGGGAIYHDTAGDVAYSIIAPAEAFPGDVTASYRELLEPILATFESLDIDVGFAPEPTDPVWEPLCYLRGLDPAHDLVGPDGRKIAGNAQYRTRDAIVQHGSLSFDVSDQHLACFDDPPVSAETFEQRVCGAAEASEYDEIVETSVRTFSGYDLQRSRMVADLETALGEWADTEAGSWTDAELERARELRDRKYDDDAWVRDREDPLA